MKKIKSLIFATLLLTSLNTNAALSGVSALFALAPAKALALVGVTSYGAGYITMKSSANEFAGLELLFFGIVFLEEEGNFEVGEISKEAAAQKKLDLVEVEQFNAEIENVNILVEEVASQLTQDSTIDDSRDLWKEYKEYISPATFSILQKITTK